MNKKLYYIKYYHIQCVVYVKFDWSKGTDKFRLELHLNIPIHVVSYIFLHKHSYSGHFPSHSSFKLAPFVLIFPILPTTGRTLTIIT